jgi:hypothetical protein
MVHVMSILVDRKGGDAKRLNGIVVRQKDSTRVFDSEKVYQNCQKDYTDCQLVYTDFKAKKGGFSPPPSILHAGVTHR